MKFVVIVVQERVHFKRKPIGAICCSIAVTMKVFPKFGHYLCNKRLEIYKLKQLYIFIKYILDSTLEFSVDIIMYNHTDVSIFYIL